MKFHGSDSACKSALASDGSGGGSTDVTDTARVQSIEQEFAQLTAAERIGRFRAVVVGRVVFTTSFGLEDQVILHFICEREHDIDVVTLDTGRLFPETYALWADSEHRYGRRIHALYPERRGLEAFVAEHGINGFYDSRAARLACCGVRKVEPLGRALKGAKGWIAGLRAEQSAHRQGMQLLSADARGLLKLNLLFDWTWAQTLDFANSHSVPVNPLHAQGFASIGCAPCTRAIQPGEPERAGRWWWEDEAKKECGLHVTANGRVERGESGSEAAKGRADP